ncbi:MAG TPA: ribosome small subunit-dependent GTPase A [Vicinamibacteria bacterium]|nr:ribosome small subunit-dependent GTPase A [Vicinamibacteria bacterium]
MSDLAILGFDDDWAREASAGPEGTTVGRVTAGERGRWTVITADGETAATLAGRLKHEGRPDTWPAVGDWVMATPRADGARIERILPRRSQVTRKVKGEVTEAQVLAANVDVLFLVTGLDHDYNPRRMERALALAWESGARPVIVLNKADLGPDVAAARAEMESVGGGVPVHVTNARTGEGVAGVKAELGPSGTGVLIGSSGAGKSTLTNRLLGYERQATGEVRVHDSRGKHVTRRREMVLLPGGGCLIDTPGIREIQLWEAAEGVEAAFTDIAALAAECRFRDCSHGTEPGCALRAAREEGRIGEERWASYLKLQDEVRQQEVRRDARARLDEKRKWRAIHKAARNHHPRG